MGIPCDQAGIRFLAAARVASAKAQDRRICRSMHRGQFTARHHGIGFGVAHLVSKAQYLVADLDDVARDLDDVAGQQFLPVGDVLLHRRHAATIVAQRRLSRR
jgi:hypothetical protein